MPPTTATPGVRRFARRWAEALSGVAYSGMNRAEANALLCRLTVKLIEAARSDEPRRRELGRAVGSALVTANYRDPAVANRTISLLGSHFLADLGEPAGISGVDPVVS